MSLKYDPILCMMVEDKNAKTMDAKTTRDGMFSKTFSEYTRGAEYKAKHGLSELSKIRDKNQFASVNKIYDDELNKSLERLIDALNVAISDYNAERNKIIEIAKQFNKDAFRLYKNLVAGRGE